MRGVLTKGLRLVHFDQVAERAGISGMLQRAGTRMDAARLLATIAFWWIFLMFIDTAFNALSLPTITAYINALLAYLPRLFVAFLIVVVGALIANVVAGAVRGATAETGTATSGLLHLLPHGLHDPLFQLPKNGPDGLRDLLLHCLVQGLPATRRLFCLRALRLRGLWRLFLLGLQRWLLQLGDHRIPPYQDSCQGPPCSAAPVRTERTFRANRGHTCMRGRSVPHLATHTRWLT